MAESTLFDPYQMPMDQEGIKKIIPHRDPFLLVDRITSLTEDSVIGEKTLSGEEDFFRGHFPSKPVMPGVLMIEALAQVTGVMICSRPDFRNRMGFFASINKVKFREMVSPGSTLRLESIKVREKKMFYIAQARAMLGDKMACEAEIMLYMDVQ
ncbi:MAG: 3-hydroxyacyl-[acyl-carrier-protein] dehydratase [Candidatus Omnitrophota bacterium]|jgi:3-hydroxyacyl-[acyl-carrier-protein] dehydratase